MGKMASDRSKWRKLIQESIESFENSRMQYSAYKRLIRKGEQGPCADMLYRSYLIPPDIPVVVFVELMKFATTSTKFNFDNIIYRQVDGISIRSVLGPTMAGIFVDFHEVYLFSKSKAPEVYFRYVDDTFCVFGNETETGEFFSHLNSMHPVLRFTLEKEYNSALPFLDVLVCKETSAFLMTVYRKSTFTGLYIRRYSFSPKKRKINLIKTLTHRALMISSETKLDDEVKSIPGTLCNNSFPEEIVQSVIRDKISDFCKIKPDSVQRCPVYLRLPWLGDISGKFANQISACVRKCYFSSNLHVVFHTRIVLTSGRKEVLHPTPNIVVLLHVFADCNTSREPINVWI